MGHVHYFVVDDLSAFRVALETRGYSHRPMEPEEGWVTHSKILSNAVEKQYSYPQRHRVDAPIQIRVTYRVLHEGRPLKKVAEKLKKLNARYLRALPIWKTKRRLSETYRRKRWQDIQKFLHEHKEMIGCFRYEGIHPQTEGNPSFNLHVASTPKERNVCFEFITALMEAFTPSGVVRGRRQADVPRQQRDGWIRRYAEVHKNRGWSPHEVAREIQRELREGTWNERSRLQYNLANNTICRIAGFKMHNPSHA